MVGLGRAVSWHRQNCNKQIVQRVQNIGRLDCVKILGHDSDFPNRRFLHCGGLLNKKSSGINGKTSDYFYRIVWVPLTFKLSNVSASNCSLHFYCLFADFDFLMVRANDCKNLLDQPTQMSVIYSCSFVY